MPRDLTVPPREHTNGCPATRQEDFEVTRPNGERVTVVRCLECGGQTIIPTRGEETDEQ